MIRETLLRLAGRVDGDEPDVASLLAQIRRLEAQNERLRRSLRTCTDCEYRVEVIGRRAAAGLNADGSAPD